ncbi:hypothetical protein AB0L41_43265 [Amycolatopsis mediterranei]|uniref:hypothetical protein n=1 Tax=Amycolatopsis mediterranei TaxID=33910 RepID=UPI003416027C
MSTPPSARPSKSAAVRGVGGGHLRGGGGVGKQVQVGRDNALHTRPEPVPVVRAAADVRRFHTRLFQQHRGSDHTGRGLGRGFPRGVFGVPALVGQATPCRGVAGAVGQVGGVHGGGVHAEVVAVDFDQRAVRVEAGGCPAARLIDAAVTLDVALG